MRLVLFLTIVLLVTSCLGQLNRLFLGSDTNVVLYANDLLMAVIAGLYLGYAFIVRRSWHIPPVMLAFGAFLVIGGLGLLLAGSWLSRQDLFVSASYLFRLVAYAALFFIAYDTLQSASSPEVRHRVVWRWVVLLLAVSMLMAVSGFIQLFVLPDLSVLAKYGWDPHQNRLVTSMLDPNYAGTYLAMGVALCLSLMLYLDAPRVRLPLAVVSTVLVLAVLLTYSRSGYLMLGLVLLILSLVKSRWLLVAGTIAGIITVAAVPRIQSRVEGAIHPDASASLRVVSWQNSWHIAEDNLFLGVGFNSYRYAQDRYGIVSLDQSGNAGAGADSSWLFIIATTGLVGLATFVLFYTALLWSAWRAFCLQSDPLLKSVALASLAILIGLAVASQFNNALFYTWILEWWWVLLGLTVALDPHHTPASRS